MNAEKLAVDVLLDILSVVTLANFGAAAKTGAASTYDDDAIADLQTVANDANWPDTGRGLIVNTAINAALQKTDSFKLALNYGGSEVIREGRLPKVFGFDFAWMNNLPANGENLIGMIAFASAILAAFSPVQPGPGVRRNLVAYEVVTDPATGISFNYRHWGDSPLANGLSGEFGG